MTEEMFAKPANSWSVDEYKRFLQIADWWYEYTDDGEVWRKAKRYFQKLEEVCAVLDPDKIIWRQYDRTPGFEP